VINIRWRVLIGSASACALAWGTAGAVHLGLVHHGVGRRGGYDIAEGGGWYEIALSVGFIVTIYSIPGLLRQSQWWPALSLTLGAAVGVASVLTLGQSQRHWTTAAIMTAVGVAAPVANRCWGRHHPIAKQPAKQDPEYARNR
jgi:hypothetical protein